ncbi:hypothetical protein C8F04DRAFT_1116694 [Mycena alexandri]|uniref:Uncharacterized protein n=1 Tax=Mycena alexandri TaxID=1745969 RepID=A0AAD6SML4_9AGAR|nr:hypothetical protein C8F04DRAFT_1116694 [Mycena alexandri]
MDSECSFPLDIEREIFETTAIRYRKSIPTLLRVCHRVHTWVEPLLYAALHISKANDSILAVLRSKPATFLQNAVRHVFLHHTADTKEVNQEVLSTCSGIINLVIDRGFDLDLLPILDTMHLRRLDLYVPPIGSQWAHSILKHPLFFSITHLSFYQNHNDDPEPSKWDDWSQLAALPALTHLCLSEDISSVFPETLNKCRRLVLAVTLFWTRAFRTRAIAFVQRLAFTDARFLVMVTPNAVTSEWQMGARGGDDFWVRAEKFIARRQAGEIESAYGG